MPIYEFEGVRPVVSTSAFVHPTATLIGDVIIGDGCLVGPGASLRGDIGRIVLEAGSNVQDNCTLHTFPGRDCVVREMGHIGHGAVLHGCTIGRNAMVGMLAVVMDDASIGENAFVAAMALVTAKMDVPAATLVGGVPAKVMRALRPEEIEWKTQGTIVYQRLAERSLATMRETEPLSALPAGRARVPVIEYETRGDRGLTSRSPE